MLGCNETTEIIDVDNNEGIDDDNKCNVHVPEIIDIKSEKIDVKTKSITVGKNKNNIIDAEMVLQLQIITCWLRRHFKVWTQTKIDP